MFLNICVIDALARATGTRYSTFDVVGAGPRVVAGIAEKYGQTAFYTYEDAIKRVSRLLSYDVLMISAMSSDYGAVKKLLATARSRGFRGKVIIGGPISFEYSKLLSNLPIDYVIVGEGEIPLTKLLPMLSTNSIKISEIPAIAYVEEGVVKVTSGHIYTPVEVLNSILPWSRVDEAFKHPQIYRFYVEVVRGCSNYHRPRIKTSKFTCIDCSKCYSSTLEERLTCPIGIPPGCGFCSVPYMFGPPRSRSIESIKREVEELIAHGARRIVLSGPDFLDYMREKLVGKVLTDPCYPPANIDAIEQLLNELFSISEVKNGRVVIMVENIKACLVNEEVASVLGKYLKGTTIHIGLETGSKWFNEVVLGKPIFTEDVVKASKLLSSQGLRPYIYLIYGLPFTTREVYRDTIEAVELLKLSGVEKITLYKFINLPATAFEDLKPNVDEFRDAIRELKKLVDKYNMVAKRKLLGARIEAWLYESKGRIYGYPVNHGPVIFVEHKGKAMVSGCRGLIEITDIGTRFARGRLISILECP